MGDWGGTSFKRIDGQPNVEAIVGYDGRQHVDTYHQDQSTDPIIVDFNKVTNSTTLAAPMTLNSYIANVVSATGIVADSYFILFDPSSLRFSTFYVVSVAGTAITLDSPVDYAYPAGTNVDVAITNMAVNGAVTPQVFGLRGTGIIPGVEITYQVTRLIMICYTNTAVSLATFGDLAKLTRGVVCRKRNGVYKNVFNVKSNGEIARLTLDWYPYVATNPAQDVDGFYSRLTFNGNDKLGVVVELPIGEDMEIWIQDDLTGLVEFKMEAQGHLTENGGSA